MLHHGFLVLDKPLGISSAKAVSQVKRILNCKKIGHGGTLDPLASGILPLAIGEATKAFDYVVSAEKEYHFTITFGQERSTDDAEGEVTATTDYIPLLEEVKFALPSFVGIIEQIPPIYSALRLGGQPAYKRARAGEAIVMQSRPVTISSLSIISNNENSVTLSVSCGKGTYVRSLARDIARHCNSLGYVSMLRRTRVGKFDLKKAILLDNLEEVVHSGALFESWMPIELTLDDIPAIELDSISATRLRNGQVIDVDVSDGQYLAMEQGKLIATSQVIKHKLKSVRVFNI